MSIFNRMKDLNLKYKTIVIGSIAFVVISLLMILLKTTFSSNTPQVFNGYKLKNSNVDNVVISSISIKEENNITKYEAEIMTNEDMNVSYINIIFKDGDNKEIVRLVGYVGTNLKKDEKKHIEASTDADLSKIKSIEYEVIKS